MSKKLGAVQIPKLAGAALRLQGFGVSILTYVFSSRDLLIHKYLRFLAEFCFNTLVLALFVSSE